MSVRVSFPNLFQNEKNAGLSFEEWHELSSSEQLTERLMFIYGIADALEVSIKSSPDNALHHVYRHTLRLKEQTHRSLKLIKDGELFESMNLMLDVGKTMQEIKSLPAIHNALKTWEVDVSEIRQKDFQRRSLGGIEAAKTKQTEKQKRMDKVREMWSSLSKTPERERAGIIATSTGYDGSTVRQYIREMELKKQ